MEGHSGRMPVLCAPCDVLSVEECLKLRKALIATGRFANEEQGLTIDRIRRYAYKMSEYESRLWEDEIQIMCPEPFCWYINTLRYAKDMKWKTSEIEAFYLTGEDEGKVFDKFDWRKVWVSYDGSHDDLVIVDYVGLDEALKEADDGWEWVVIEAFVKHIQRTNKKKKAEGKLKKVVKKVLVKEPEEAKPFIEDPDIPQAFLDHCEYEEEIKRGK